jgi:antibiotic biosynthesis monooxygenase (ABM) superfamily enzyme
MASMIVTHKVKDFSIFKKTFDSVIDLRKSNGELSDRIYREASDPNELTLNFNWNSLANAQKYAHSPELKVAMDKAGVVGIPEIHFLNEA